MGRSAARGAGEHGVLHPIGTAYFYLSYCDMLNASEKKRIYRFMAGAILSLAIYFVLISLLIHFERDSAQSAITNYHQAVWYTIVTLTTVGYGDIYPVTIYGRLIGFVFVLLSIGVYGFLIGKITTLLSSLKQNKMLGYNGTLFEHHVVMIGWNELGHKVTEQVIGAGRQAAIVTNVKEHVEHIHKKYDKKNVFVLYSDFDNTELLKKANIEQSSVVFVNMKDDTEKLVFILDMKKKFASLAFIVALENANLKNTFINAGATYAISPHDISSKILASYMFEPDVAGYTEDLMSFATKPHSYDIKQFLVTHDNPYLNQDYQLAFAHIKKKLQRYLDWHKQER